MRKIAFASAAIEATSLLLFAFSLLVNNHGHDGTRGSTPHPYILSFLYVVFSLGVGAIAFGILRAKAWARTPFVLIQVFAILVFAYLPASGSGILSKIAGYLVGALAFIGLVAHWRSPVKDETAER